MQTFTWQETAEIRLLDQELMAETTTDDLIFGLFPITTSPAAMVIFEVQDEFHGLMQGRGYNGEFPSVPGVGYSQRMKRPGVYGEFSPLDELELTTRAASGTLANVPMPVDDMVAARQRLLIHRQVQRMRWTLWTLLTTGAYVVQDAKGAVIDSDAFTPFRFTALVPWATHATATPLADLRSIQLLSRGSGVNFGPSATLLMTQKTFNDVLSNTNTADLGGKKTIGGSTLTGLGDVNRVMVAEGLPQVAIYEEGYRPTAGGWQLWVPDDSFTLVGRRKNGAPIGNFIQTKNVNNPDNGPQVFTKVIDTGAPNGEPPRQIKVYRGFNGGPAIYYGNSVVIGAV